MSGVPAAAAATDAKSATANGKKRDSTANGNNDSNKSLVNEFEAAYSDLLSSFNAEDTFFQVRI